LPSPPPPPPTPAWRPRQRPRPAWLRPAAPPSSSACSRQSELSRRRRPLVEVEVEVKVAELHAAQLKRLEELSVAVCREERRADECAHWADEAQLHERDAQPRRLRHLPVVGPVRVRAKAQLHRHPPRSRSTQTTSLS
jgi:hypothetical protein